MLDLVMKDFHQEFLKELQREIQKNYHSWELADQSKLQELQRAYSEKRWCTKHVYQRMERREISFRELHHAVFKGKIIEHRKSDDVYLVAGWKENGEKFYAVVGLHPHHLSIVTVCNFKEEDRFPAELWEDIPQLKSIKVH